MKKKGYGFIYEKDLPAVEYEDIDIEGLCADEFAVTGTYSSFARNHCATVCLTNLIKIMIRQKNENVLSVFEDKTEEKDIFSGIYAFTGNGPVIALYRKLAAYLRNMKLLVKKEKYKSVEEIKEAIKNQIPVALLLKGFSMTDWHWVICVGVRTGEDGKVYFRIIDNWNKTLKRFMPVNKKRPWISALSFEINKK